MTNKVLRHVWVLLAEANFMNSSLNFPGISQTKLSPKSNNYARTKDPSPTLWQGLNLMLADSWSLTCSTWLFSKFVRQCPCARQALGQGVHQGSSKYSRIQDSIHGTSRLAQTLAILLVVPSCLCMVVDCGLVHLSPLYFSSIWIV